MALSIISKSDFSVEQSEQRLYRCTVIAPGYGYCLTIYSGVGNPLPSFKGAAHAFAAGQCRTNYDFFGRN